MRNIFDQYESPENRLTHALGCCLQLDRNLLRPFVTWLTGRRSLAWGKLEVLEQQVPGVPVDTTNDGELGLPDLWIHGDGDWSLIIESKVQAKVTTGQLHRHLRRARRNGFGDVDLVVLAPTLPKQRNQGIIYRTWPEVYCWLRRQARNSQWASSLAEYFEVAETKMTADGYLQDGSLTEFDGIPFGPDHPYSYREAKRLLKLAMGELRKRRDLEKLGMNPRGQGRPAITGQAGSAVWDFIPLKAAGGKAAFTSCPHLTLSIQSQRLVVIVTLPNAVGSAMRRNLVDLPYDEFCDLVGSVERGVSKAVRRIKRACPHIEAVQRHYPSQRARPIVDARLEFDLRTATGNRRAAVKSQPQWLESVYAALQAKKSNLQVGIGALLPYGDSALRSREVLKVIAGVWLGCRPWIDAIVHSKT